MAAANFPAIPTEDPMTDTELPSDQSRPGQPSLNDVMAHFAVSLDRAATVIATGVQHAARELARAACSGQNEFALAPPPVVDIERQERYAVALHDAVEADLSLADQEPAVQALYARQAEAAMALADTELEELRTENERMRHELQVMYGGAFDPLPDRAVLRDRIAQVISDGEGWSWAADADRSTSPAWQRCLRTADAVLAVLPTPTDPNGA